MTSVQPIPAATVLVLRDGRDGIEVFMLRRHLDSDFVGGAYVFPGGKVDDQDRNLDADLMDAHTDDSAYRAAAIRETFEESGILITTAPLPPDAGADEARRKLSERGQAWDWRPWLRQHGCRMALTSLAWWSWWVTPEGSHRRFDTRFYLCELPANSSARHDGIEATDSRWVTPAWALRAAAAGEVSIILPTRKNLEALLPFGSAAEAVQASRDLGENPPRIEPTMTTVGDEILISHPTFEGTERF